jgi:hypothetical protein
VQPKLVGLDRVPGKVKSRRPPGRRSDPVLPAVVGHEVAAGIAHDCWCQLASQGKNVFPQPGGLGAGMPRLVQAGVDTATHVLDECAEEAPRHRTDGVRGIKDE